jgi:hypothetical protein
MQRLKSASQFRQYLEHLKIPFRLQETSNSQTIEAAGYSRVILSDEFLNGKELAFVKSVKKEIERRVSNKEAETIDPDAVKYFRFGKYPPGEYSDILELDINSAYWKTAHDLKVISPETYQNGLTVTKRARLVALGSIASVKHIYQFDGVELNFCETKENLETRGYFFKIADTVSRIILDFIEENPNAVFFFWVDALFIKAEIKNECLDFFRARGYEMKQKPIEKMTIEKTERGNKYILEMKDGKTKTFQKKMANPEADKKKKAEFFEQIKKAGFL